MVGLLELQRQMAGAVRGPGSPDLAGLYRPDHLPPGHPLSVYRNNHLLSLTAVLAVTFPTVTKLIGADAMQVVAEQFLMLHPPRQPCVAEYGGDFAGYLEGEALADELPYLPDLARLDWALNRARNAIDAAPFTAQELTALAPDRLCDLRVAPHPSLTLLASDFALPQLHQSVHGAVPEKAIASRHASHLKIWSRHGDVKFASVAADAFAGAEVLAKGGSLSQACEKLQLTAFPDFLAHFLCSGAFIGEVDQPR